MKWQCALLQRWLPEYPDGDLPAFWKRRLRGHLEHCPTCRQELAALRDVVQAIQAAPVADPGPEFWSEFSRQLHLKLAQAAHAPQAVPEPPAPRRFKLPYLVGAPVLAMLLLWVATYWTNPERPVVAPQPQVAQKAAPEKALAKAKVRAAPKAEVAQAPAPPTRAAAPEAEQYIYATTGNNDTPPEDDLDIANMDLDSVLAGMTEQEKEAFLKNLHQREKDGSCLEHSYSIV